MNRLHRCLACLAIVLFCSSSPTAAAREINLTIGKQEVLDSKVLGEKRDILVYASPQLKPGAPLLVLLDADWNFQNVAVSVQHLVSNGRLPPMVVAGIVNTNRGRDLTPTLDGAEFAAGPSDRFLSFIADELIPHMAAEFPLGRFRAIAGHSNGGMFALYAFIRRPEVFQANIALSPSWGLDDRFVALLERALGQPSHAQRFVFIGAGGDEEADISVGALRFAKTFESGGSANVDFHYQVFPGETHGSVGLRAFYAALEALGQPDTRPTFGPARYLSEAQRRRHTWVRRFGSAFHDDQPPEFSVALPLLDGLTSSDSAGLKALWERLQSEFAGDFRSDATERRNLIAALEAQGRGSDAALLRALPGFTADGGPANNYGKSIDLDAGLVADLPLHGSAVDRRHPSAVGVVHGAVPVPGRNGGPDGAYRFDGHGAFIEFPRNPDYATAGSISASAWVRPHSRAAYAAWMAQVTGWGASQWRLGLGPNPAAAWGPTTYGTRWTDYWIHGDSLPVDTWVHTAVVFDQTLGELHTYVNGREVQSVSGLMPWSASPGPILIGAQRDDGIFFDGDVEEVRIYHRALSAAEVEAIGRLE